MSEGFLSNSIESLESIFPIFTWRELEPDLSETELVQGVSVDYGLVVEIYRGYEEDSEYYGLAYWRPIDDEDAPLIGEDGFALPATPMDAKMLKEIEDSSDMVEGEVDFWGQIRAKAPERDTSVSEVAFRTLANLVGTSGMMLHIVHRHGQELDAMLDAAARQIPGVQDAEANTAYTGAFGDGVAASVGAEAFVGDKLESYLTEAYEDLSGHLKDLEWEKTPVLVRGESEFVRFALIPAPIWNPDSDEAPKWLGVVNCFLDDEDGDGEMGLNGHTGPGVFFDDPIEAFNEAISSIGGQIDDLMNGMSVLQERVIEPLLKRSSLRLVKEDE